LLAEQLQPVLKQNVVVDNRGGAGGNLGADAVAKAEKDGYSVLLGSANILCANKFLFRRSMPLDPMRDLAPVTRVTTGTVVLIVNGRSPYKTFQDLIAAAKKDPGKLTMGSSGTGTVSHLTIESVKRAAGVDITHVPYRGGGPAFQDLLAGNIDLMFDVIPAAIGNIREGAFRPLAVGSAERIAYVPELREVPSMKELLPGSNIDMQSWYGINAPAGTPADRIAILHRALAQVVQGDAFRQKMEPIGFTPGRGRVARRLWRVHARAGEGLAEARRGLRRHYGVRPFSRRKASVRVPRASGRRAKPARSAGWSISIPIPGRDTIRGAMPLARAAARCGT
jgi:tripartite-type tricarboxylate transporter receptor subunit TctC